MSQEPPSPKSTPAPDSSKATAASDQGSSRSKPQSLLRMLGQLGGIVLAFVPVLLSLLRQLWQLLLPILKWFGKQWTAVLPKIRTILPGGLSKLPDQALTALTIALVLLLLLIPRAFIANRSPAVAKTPDGMELIDQPNEPPVVKRPNPNAKRIATIQNQLMEVSAPYVEDLVQAVQADFARGRLLLSVTDGWNALEPSQREQLANELLKRSKKLKFDQLEITDAEGTLLARSPVVGSNIVLLRATKPA
jgi:hypothetical protein